MKMLSSTALVVCLAAMSGCGPVVKEINEEGLKEYRAGRYVESIGLFKTALKKDMGRPSTLYYIGRSYLALAEERFRAGNSRMARRNLDDAAYYLDRAIALFPNYDEAIRAKTRALELRGEYDKALNVVQQTDDLLGPSAKTKIMLAEEYEQRGDVDNALLTYRRAVAVEPLNPYVRLAFGRFYKRINRRDHAVYEFTRAYRLDPELPEVVAELKSLGAWPVE